MKRLVKLDNDKEVLIVNQINEYLDTSYIYVPIDNKNYKVEDYLYKNSFIGDNIVSISGKIAGFENIKYNTSVVKCIKVINDFKELAMQKGRKRKIKTKNELINYLENFHLRKIINKIEEKETIKNIVISSIDEESYCVTEFMILTKYYNELIETLNYLLNIFAIDKGIIATKDTDSEAIKNVKSILGTYPNIKLNLLPNRYLISYEDNLCEYLNIKNKETLILTTSELLDLYYVLKKAKYNDSKIVTISGNNLVKSLVINTKIGTPLEEIINKYFILKDNDYEIYLNGYLSGYQVSEIKNVIITKETHTVIINKRVKNEETECINCGACYKICPQNINVLKCFKEKRYSKKCLGCGLCNYICPANLKLKEIVKEESYEEKNN